MWLVGVGEVYVVSRRWVWVGSMGVVARRYIDFLILLIPTPLVSAHFCSIPTFFIKKNVFCSCYGTFCNLVIIFSRSINTHTGDYGRPKEAI